jgi:hypothetical protein
MPVAEQELYDRLLLAQKIAPTAPTATSTPDSSKPVTLRNLFTHPDSHPVALDFALLKAFGNDWYAWEAETLWDEIPQTFGTQISELCRQKIRAIQACKSSVLPWKSWQVFEKVAAVFNGSLPTFEIAQPLSVGEIYAAVDILDFLRKVPYDDQVKLYLAATILDNDLFFVPPPLDFIQMEVAQPFIHCADCGNDEPALFHDGACSNCTQRMHPEQMLTMQPRQDLVNAGKGKNTTTSFRYDPTSVAKRWEEVKTASLSEIERTFSDKEMTMEDVQVRQLLYARDYMNIRRQQLTEQLTALKSWMATQ